MANTEEFLGTNFKDFILSTLQSNDPKTYSKMQAFKDCIRLDKITNFRYSVAFLFDLYFGVFNCDLDIEPVLHEISYMEGIETKTRTKKETQFKHQPLKGLWHKHYFEGSIQSLFKNIDLAFKNYGVPYFQTRINDCKENNKIEYVTLEDIPRIVEDATHGNIKRRMADKKITGEWIVYAIYQNNKYYLCLGNHNEGDEVIYNKIKSICFKEFPFLTTT